MFEARCPADSRPPRPQYPFPTLAHDLAAEWLNPSLVIGNLASLPLDSASAALRGWVQSVATKMDARAEFSTSQPQLLPSAIKRRFSIAEMQSLVLNLVQELVGNELEGQDLDTELPLVDMGLDSLATAQLVQNLNAKLNVDIPPSFLFDYPTVQKLSPRIIELLPAEVTQPQSAFSISQPQFSIAEMQSLVLNLVQELVGNELEGQDLDTELPLVDMGLDSLATAQLVQNLNAKLNVDIPPSFLFDYPTVQKLSPRIIELLPVQGVVASEGKALNMKPLTDTQHEVDVKYVYGLNIGTLVKLPRNVPQSDLPIIFILSTVRTGSSLLQLCLDCHPDIYAPPELHLLSFRTMQDRNRYMSENARSNPTGFTKVKNGLVDCVQDLWQCDWSEADKIVESWSDLSTAEVFKLIQLRCRPKILAEKTPNNTAKLVVLESARAIFPDALYIHLVRHPLPVLVSWQGLNKGTNTSEGALQPSWGLLEQLWRDWNQAALTFTERISSDRWTRLRYEDLCRSPSEYLREVCSFLKLEYVESMAHPYDQDYRYKSSGGAHDPKLFLKKRIDPMQAEKWKEIVPPEPVQISTRNLAKAFDYTFEVDAVQSSTGSLAPMSSYTFETDPTVFRHQQTIGENSTMISHTRRRRQRVLVLHGSGMTASQMTERLSRHGWSESLLASADLFTVDAPHMATHSHGRRFFANPILGGGHENHPDKSTVELEQQWHATTRFLDSIHREQGPFDGYVGFSEGGAIACWLALTQASPVCRFVISISAPRLAEMQASVDEAPIASLHVHGRSDSICSVDDVAHNTKLFNQSQTYLHNGGHALPGMTPDLSLQIHRIIQAAEDGTAGSGTGSGPSGSTGTMMNGNGHTNGSRPGTDHYDTLKIGR